MNKKYPFIGPFLLLISGILIASVHANGFWLFAVIAVYGLFLKGNWFIHWGYLIVLLIPGLLGVTLMKYHTSKYSETERVLKTAPSILIRIQHVDVLNLAADKGKVKIQAEIVAQVNSNQIEFLTSSDLDLVCPSTFLNRTSHQAGVDSVKSAFGSSLKFESVAVASTTVNKGKRKLTTVESAIDLKKKGELREGNSIKEVHLNDWLGAIVLIEGWKVNDFSFGRFPKHKIYLNSYSQWVPLSSMKERSIFQQLQYFVESAIATRVRGCLSDDAWNLFLKLMLGQKGAMDRSEMRYFQKAGIVHVLSVSGMHVALIFSILFWPLKWIRWPWMHRIAWLIIMFVIWLYGSITGMSPPVERAVWAITYSQIGQQIFHRKIWIADSYFFVGSLQLMLDPLMIFDVGFQLSYAAMAGIALVVPNYNEWQLQKEWPNWKGNLVSGIVISFVCSLTTLPVVLYYFHQFSNWFVLGNMLLIPLFTVLIYAYLGLIVFAFLGVFSLFEELQQGCLLVFDLFLLIIHKVLVFIDNMPFGFSYAPNFTGMHAIVLSSIVVFWIHRIHFPHERKWTNWAVFSFLILVSL